jgi:hypothetical protein
LIVHDALGCDVGVFFSDEKLRVAIEEMVAFLFGEWSPAADRAEQHGARGARDGPGDSPSAQFKHS